MSNTTSGISISAGVSGIIEDAPEQKVKSLRLVLELIKARAIGGGNYSLQDDMNNIPQYMAIIESALKESP
ncbi:hypothetical protein [Marinibactrum halimedae]|uniref:Uncharacterized protein n=1 Tax=Marinibactrum halimedae TaxID=1444977 RepID=A0AA37T723_9GAMM|nr:hypothetical protein [Marinibactrum halimedae]MCD9460977.1 hypothetical protein [Marinibactrum halimedae]GLS28079.1 hypothetical protein GCM10007877_37980 [Marinibactrum halimedae]